MDFRSFFCFSEMTVYLRAHHLLCILSYVGEGYNSAFVAHCTAIIARISGGEEIAIVEGRDDICASLLGDNASHCLLQSVLTRDAIASQDLEDLIGVGPILADARFVLDYDIIVRLRMAFASRSIRGACQGCDWFALCDEVSGCGYSRAKLKCS